MALVKRNKVWWIDISHLGQRIRKSTGTNNKIDAKRLHDQIKADLWQQAKLQTLPKKLWLDAVIRYLDESKHKRSLITDKFHLRWLDPHLRQYYLHEINSQKVENLAKLKEASGAKPSTVNRTLEIIRAILRKAKYQWEWLDKIPNIRMRPQENKRIRWLTPEEAKRLLQELPPHLKDMAAFTLNTGLRAANVTGLLWQNVDLQRQHAWINPEQAKTKRAIAIPLNQHAMIILKQKIGQHPKFVFTYNNHPIKKCNTKAWKNALKRANIDNFKWHDLRHTWASWHVQNGTSLQELQQLGGWCTLDMVLRYAHLSSNHLREAAARIYEIGGTNLL